MVEVAIRYDHNTGDVHITCTNSANVPCTVQIVNKYATDEASRTMKLEANDTAEEHWPLAASASWFDVSITVAESPAFLRRFAGHVETGRPSTSDPAVFSEEA